MTADPIPALSADSEPMIDSVAGAVVMPRPAPRKTICPTISRYGVEADAVDTQANPIAIESRPLDTNTVVP